ncbi:MAG TPA: acyl-CoA dehydrogenase family protein, partial [Burkholderiales bacterium]|nr:acyl-CoA dehydrogenase family protein [Burkholderiales bacterium]
MSGERPLADAAGDARLLEARVEERRQLAAAAEDFARRSGGVARARRLRGTRAEHDPQSWRTLAALGWLGILVPQRYCGLGLGVSEMAIVARALGRVLAPEPLAAAAVLAGVALCGCENEALKAETLPQLAAG